MKKELEIVKNLLLPLLEGEKSILTTNINWQDITSGFVFYENDSKLLYTEIYRLELSDPEGIISKLPELHQLFIIELAEEHVLGKENAAIEELLKHNSVLFSEKVSFFKTLKNVITKQERERIINELPRLSERIDFSLSDNEIKSVIKKKARGDLKDKFKNWDRELKKEEEKDVISFDLPKQADYSYIPEESKLKGKVVSLSWVKYAVAACIVITAGLFYFKPFDAATTNRIANVETSSQNVSIIVDKGLGYTSNEINQHIEVVIIDHANRITLIKKMIDEKSINDLTGYKKELDSLKKLDNTYTFNKKQLTINLKNENQEISIIYLNEIDFYLKLNDRFYSLIESDSPIELVVEKDQNTIQQLEKIIFEND